MKVKWGCLAPEGEIGDLMDVGMGVMGLGRVHGSLDAPHFTVRSKAEQLLEDGGIGC
jgi:hypothetical protein